VSIADYEPLPEGRAQYSPDFMAARGAIKLRENQAEIWIGIAPGFDSGIRNSLSNFHRLKQVHFVDIDRADFAAYIGNKGAPASAGEAGLGQGTPEKKMELDRPSSDAPIVNLVNSIIIDALREGASDIHIEALENSLRVRCRVDGFLRTEKVLDKSLFPAISTRIKVMAALNVMEKRLPQDGRISVGLDSDRVDLRVSIVPTAEGESIVLRLFNRSGSAFTLPELGFSPEQYSIIQKLIRMPYGLILVTGPTGSGKTTTLNAMLRVISTEKLKVITIEDPVEYLIDGVSQIQTNEHIKLGFDTVLRRVLRQDPDVIMVGEIRDPATAALAVRAAMTGHLVLSTLHTNSSVSAVTRLRNMGVESYLAASVLRGVLAQRLVRKLCPACRQPLEAGAEERAFIKSCGLAEGPVYGAQGCSACGGSGYRGRLLISEGFLVDEELEELIGRGERASALSACLAGRGMVSMASDGLKKAFAGLTSIGELERELCF